MSFRYYFLLYVLLVISFPATVIGKDRCSGGPKNGEECIHNHECNVCNGDKNIDCTTKKGRQACKQLTKRKICVGNEFDPANPVTCSNQGNCDDKHGDCLYANKCSNAICGKPTVRLQKCDIPQIVKILTGESFGITPIKNTMDGSCQLLLISQPTLSVDDSQTIFLPSSNSLKSVSLDPPYDSSNIQISEAGAIIDLAPLFGRSKTMNIYFELNSPAEPNTVINVSCPCPLDVKLSSFKATLETAKEQVAITWEILEGNNAYLNIWGAQLEANEFNNVTQFNTKPILIDETAPLMNFSLVTNQLNPGVTYFTLESVGYDGECITYCDDIDAVVLGPVEADLEFVKNLCKQEMKRQIALFGNTGSCVK